MTKPRSRRHLASIEVEVSQPEGDSRDPARVVNLHEDGLLIEKEQVNCAPGDPIGIEFPATKSRGRVMILGEVAWRDATHAGVRVNGMLPHHRARYDRLVTALATSRTLLG